MSTNPAPELVITEIQIWPLRNADNSRVKAMASITFNDAVRVSGCKIIEGAKGLFLSYPNEKKPGTEQWVPLFFPVNRTFGDHIQTKVLERYQVLVA